MEELLNDLIKLSLNCLEYFEKNEELSEIDANDILNEFEIVHKKLITCDSKVYAFSDGQRREISNELVFKYPECLLNVNMIDIDSRNSNHEIEIDFHLKYLDEMIKYMKNEYDISELNGVEFDEFCRELMEIRIPFRMDIMERLWNGYNEYGVRWKNRCVVVNENDYKMVFDYLKLHLIHLKLNNEHDRIEVIKTPSSSSFLFIMKDLEQYLKDPSNYVKRKFITLIAINPLFAFFSVDPNHPVIHNYLLHYTSSVCFNSYIVENIDYDSNLKEWVGHYDMKLIYRASEHGYTAKSFHYYCDDVNEPTSMFVTLLPVQLLLFSFTMILILTTTLKSMM